MVVKLNVNIRDNRSEMFPSPCGVMVVKHLLGNIIKIGNASTVSVPLRGNGRETC